MKTKLVVKLWRHFKTVVKHRWVVFKECAACGILWQGLTHDLSKFGATEFVASAKYFQGNRSPIDAEKEAVGYSTAWLHHKGHNKHHWEYWTDFDKDGTVIANLIPAKYVVEMVCDWVGAGKVYNKNKWTQAEPLDFYLKVRAVRHLHPATDETIFNLLTIIKEQGLKAFHTTCRKWLKQQ